MAQKIPVVMNFSVKDMATKAIQGIEQSLASLNDRSAHFNRELTLNNKRFEDLGKLSKTVGQGLLKIGAGLTAAITVPVVGFGVEALKAGANFEQAMNDLQARTQSSSADMELLSAEARRLGTSTVFGASDASKAMTELGKAGFNTRQIIGATGSVLNLAAAEALDMGAAATLVSDTINQFGLKADDATMVVDQLAKAAGISSISITDLQNSLKYAAPQAARFGIELDQVAASIAFLGSKGIKSEMAGTAIRSFFNSITSDVEKQNKLMKAGVFGKDLFKDKDTLKSVPDMLDALKKANLSATTLTEIFGKEFSGPIGFLIDAGETLKTMNTDILDSAGFGAEVAEARTKGFNGEMLKLKNAFEELFITVAYGENGEGSPLSLLANMVTSLRDAVLWFNQLNPTVKTAAFAFAGLAAAAGPILLALGAFAMAMPTLLSGWALLTAAAPVLGAALMGVVAVLGGPITIGLGVLATGALLAYEYWDDLVGVLKNAVDYLSSIANIIPSVYNDVKNFIPWLKPFGNMGMIGSLVGGETGVARPTSAFDRASSGLGSFKPSMPSADPGKFEPSKFGISGGVQKSEVKINLGGAVPPGTTTKISPNSDAFVTLDMGGIMR